LDLDGFKRVNDKYGHEAGDRTLELLAKILFRCIEPSDMVGRYGGDEFVIALIRIDEKQVKKIMEIIINSYGINSLREKNADDLEKIIQIADSHMYD